jgi:hypothetical protein
MSQLFVLALLCLFSPTCDAFAVIGSQQDTRRYTTLRQDHWTPVTGGKKVCLRERSRRGSDNDDESATSTRRLLLQRSLIWTPSAMACSIFLPGKTNLVAHAAMQNSQKVFEVGKDLTVEQALERFQEGKISLQYLLDHYDEICAVGGDNVRRYLGTVGTTSGLYGIPKVLKILREQSSTIDDIVEFSELSEELNSSIQQADGSAYMAIFTTSSTSGVHPQRYFEDAKTEVKQAMKTMNELSTQLRIK